MFETIVASFLNKYLSEYIDAVDYNNLKIGLDLFSVSGSFELKNVKIKPSALYQFDLPIEVKYGKIGRLKVTLPVKNYYKEPAKIIAEDLFVLLGPFEENIYDQKRVDEIFTAHKRKQLSEMEKFDKAQLLDTKQKGYADTLQDTIVNNIHIHIQNVHIRYEDKYSIKNKTISFGFYLKEFIAQTVDVNNKPYFSKADEKVIHKTGSLEGLNVYWNCNTNNPGSLIIEQNEFKLNKDKEYCANLLKESIQSGKLFNIQFETFLKANLDLETQLVLRRSYQKEDFDKPKITFNSSVRSIEFLFRRHQFKSIIEIIDCYSLLNVHKKYIKFRPKESDRKVGKANLWWKYVLNATGESKWRSYRKDRISSHWKNYKEYIKKYELKLKKEINNEKITDQEIKNLEALESKLIIESIFDARNYCKEKLKKQLVNDNNPNNDNAIDTIPDIRPKNYVELCLNLSFPLIRLKLLNVNYEILRIDFRQINAQFETRPVANNNFYFEINTQGIEVLGVYYRESLRDGTNELVTLVSSKNHFQKQNNSEKLLHFSYENNPINIENVEFSIETRVSSLEIFYEKTSITELLRFFKTDLIDFDEYSTLGKKIKENVWSTAGVLFAVDNHKQFYIKAELSSPYFIIPVSGTSKQEGDSIVFFLGKTIIQSDLQQKKQINSTSIVDLEKNFYDKLNLTVNDIQVILIPAKNALNDYLSNCEQFNYKYHLLYPVSTENTLYLSINPKYKKLPKIKIDAKCPSIRLNFSDNKIIKLADFLQKLPLPEMPKTSSPQIQKVQLQQTRVSRQSFSVERLNTIHTPVSNRTIESNSPKLKSSQSIKSTEPDDEWEGPFSLPKDINGDPIPNYTHMIFKFTINDFSIDLKGTDDHLSVDPTEFDYLNFLFKNINLNFAITKYGFHLKAKLGDLKLLDKIHITDKENPTSFTEILSSTSGKDLIELQLRQVDAQAPNFATLYSNTLFSISFKFRSIQLVAHRTGIIYFLKYGKKITENINITSTATDESAVSVSLRKEESTLVVASKKAYEEDNRICNFNVIATMSELKWKMFDNDLNFGNMKIDELSVIFKLSGIKTDMSVKLKAIFVNYEDFNTNQNYAKLFEPYKQIISCTADDNDGNFFDFKLIFYDTSNLSMKTEKPKDRFKDKIFLNIGRIKVICLVKFVNELISFIEPIVTFIEPVSNFAEQISDFTEQAVNMAVNIYQEAQTENSTKQIFLNIEVSSPLVVIPQNSTSRDAFLVELGNLFVKNKFVTEQNDSEKSDLIDEIGLNLTDVKVKRIKYKKDNPLVYDEKEKLISPINMIAIVRRTVTAVDWSNIAKLKIIVKITNLDSCISLKTAQLLFAILDENLNEGVVQEQPTINSLKTVNDKPTIKHDKPNLNQLETGKDMELFVELNEIKLKIVEFIQNGKEINVTDFSLLLINRVEFLFLKYNSVKWDALFKMKALSLSDLRPESNLAVKEMFVPINAKEYFLDLKYSNKTEFESFLEFNIDHLRINLCLPYILKLYTMAMEAISSPDKNKPPIPTPTTTTVDLSKRKANKHEAPATDSTPILIKNEQKLTLRAKARINLPEIILFAEPENPNSMILFMNVMLGLAFESNNKGLDLLIDMNELGIRLGEFTNMERRGIPFLSPCTANLKMVQKSGEKLSYYQATIDSLFFNMTPTLYKVVMGVINTLNKTGTEKKQIEEENKELLIEASEPFKIQSIRDENSRKYFSHMSVDPDIEIGEEENTNNNNNEILATDNKITELLESLDLTINRAFITFCEETGIDLQPLAVVKLDLKGRVSNWTKNLHCKADLSLEASYYNDRLSNWEPLIENVLEREDHYRPWRLNLWFAIDPSRILQPPGNETDTKRIENSDFPVIDLDYTPLDRIYINPVVELASDIQEALEIIDTIPATIIEPRTLVKNQQINASYVFVKSEDILNLNVTPSAYKVIMYLATIAAGTDKDKILENKNKAQLKFLNFLNEKSILTVSIDTMLREENAKGFHIKYQRRSIEAKKSCDKQSPSELNRRIENIITSSQRSQIDTFYDEKYKFFIQVDGFESCKLSLKTDGSYLIQLRELQTQPSESIKYNMMYRVKTNYGRTKVLFSSPLQIENDSQIKLLILVEMTQQIRDDKERFNITQILSIKSKLFENYSTEQTENESTREFGVIFELNPSKVYYVPLYFAYKCKLYTSPQNLKYAPALIFDIRGYNLRKNDTSDVICKRIMKADATDDTIEAKNDFQLMRLLALNVNTHKNVMPTMHANYKVFLFSPIKLYNCLPFDVRIDIYGATNIEETTASSTILKSDENLHINMATKKLENFKLHVKDYLNACWDSTINWPKLIESKIDNHKLEFSIVASHETFVSSKQLNVYISYMKPNEYTLYSPYWLANKSGQLIQIKSIDSSRTFDVPDDKIILFDYKNQHKKNYVKMSLKKSGSKWSSSFTLDTVGTTGMIDCKDDRKTYTFLMRSTLSNSSRTKLITFAPFLSVVNQLDERIEICEQNSRLTEQEWKSVEPDTSTAFWLNYRESSFGYLPTFMLKMNELISEPFPLDNPGRFVLLLNKKTVIFSQHPKICTVLVSGGNTNPVTIIVRKYNYGDSVAKLVNLCDNLIIRVNFDENNLRDLILHQSEFSYFVWPYPTQSKRDLLWTVDSCHDFKSLDLANSSQNKYSFSVNEHLNSTREASDDSFNENSITNVSDTKTLIANSKFKANKSRVFNAVVSCVSYMDGTQRIVLFTTDHSLADVERKKEAASMEIFAAIKGIEMSLINNVNLELATMAIKNSKPIWLLETVQGIQSFTTEYSNWLEKIYSDFVHKTIDLKEGRYNSGNKFDVNFLTMEMFKPDAGNLKRNSQPGLSVQYRASTSMMSLKCSIQQLQIDNQLPDAYFPISFYKAPSLLSDIKPEAFISLDLFTEQQEVTQIYRYFNCTQQEFFLKVDKGFLYSLWDWYDAAITTSTIEDKMFDTRSIAEEIEEPENILVIVDEEEKLKETMDLDKKLIMEIMEYATQSGGLKQSSHIRFDNFKISNLLCNLSFSVNGTAHTDDKESAVKAADTIFNFFLESIGSTITEFKDVKFMFHSFEIRNGLKTWSDLYDDLFNHYKIQALHQTYALLLGLDVIGNPFGLVTNVSHSLTDLFYDPLLGYFKKRKDDPDKETNHLELKMGSKLKDTVNKSISNLAGSGSLITGSLGRVLATCSFDNEYKRKRQYKLSKSSTWKLSDTLKIAAKGVALGTLDGLAGVIQKPIDEGPLPGLGKGIAGLFAKPFGSVFDGISLSLDGLKRFAQAGSESIVSIRLPRHLISDVAILPYSNYLAKGYEILRDLQYDDIAEDEFYWSHLFYETKKSQILIFITDCSILKLKRTRFDIRTKWKIIEDPIPIYKILRTETSKTREPDSNITKSKLKAKKHALFENKPDEFDLIVQVDAKETSSNDRQNNRRLLITSDEATCIWLSEKINSIVKYSNESKKIKI